MVVIVDYKVGNILNVENALKRVGLSPILSNDPEEILSADIVILPGVGAFKDAMESLKSTGLDEVLKKRASQNKMIIGICLGMQLLFDKSFEDGEWEGLGILKGQLDKFDLTDKSLKVPHMGWNTLSKKRDDEIIKEFKEEDYVYFVHSYYLTNYDELDLVMYSEYEVLVPAIVRRGNVIGMQFHPEKSGKAGEVLIKNIKSILEKMELENKESGKEGQNTQIKIFPAIDIKNGKCVRLLLGDKDKETVYFENPVEAAKFLKKDGAKRLHIVDLDGAFEGSSNTYEIVKDIMKETGLGVEIGGGIRSIEVAGKYADAGCDIILGTAALEDKKFLVECVKRFGDKVIVSVDCKDGYVATRGWVNKTSVKNTELIAELEEIGVKTIVYTDIACDGMLSGPNFSAYKMLSENFKINVIASGGVSSKEDVEKLNEMGLYGAIIGKALYEGNIKLNEIVGD